jgi:hypothetical protein
MAHLERISPEVITRIAGIIGQKLKALGEFSRESYGGVRAVAEMFNRLDSGTTKKFGRDGEVGFTAGETAPLLIRIRRPAVDRSSAEEFCRASIANCLPWR